LEILLQLFFYFLMLHATPLWFSSPWYVVFVDYSFVEENIFKNLCHDQGRLTCVFLVPLILLDIFVPPI
jgi:hypothetical protein